MAIWFANCLTLMSNIIGYNNTTSIVFTLFHLIPIDKASVTNFAKFSALLGLRYLFRRITVCTAEDKKGKVLQLIFNEKYKNKTESQSIV